jgi:hypothetical protein
MANFEKPLHDFTEDELQQRINQWDPRFGALALYELQRRLQEKNTRQIATLVKEIKALKDITDKNAKTTTQAARGSDISAKTAITIACLSVLFQILFSIHQDLRCGLITGEAGNPLSHYSDCYRTFDLGVFGKKTFKVKDFDATS